MKDTTRDIPIMLILPGKDIIVTVLTMPIINLLSKENTGLILPDGASTTIVLSVKIIGTGGIDLKKA
jgi:hypothetical protein